MTGYVRPCKTHMTQDDWESYQAVYCGLCRALGRRYGQAFRCLLKYDMAFYALLFMRRPVELRYRRCAAHPLKQRMVAEPHPALDLAADATILLSFGQMGDHVRDGRLWERAVSRIGLSAMRGAYRDASRRLPAAARVMEEELKRLVEMEATSLSSMDRPAAAFSTILAALGEASPEGAGAPDTRERRVRVELLRHVGRWIYLIDACDDLDGDLRQNRYNPVAARFGLSGPMPEEIRAEMLRTLSQSRQAASAALDLYGTCAYAAVAENILTIGLAAAERRVFMKSGDSNGPIRGTGRRAKGVNGRDQTRLSGTGGEISPR